MTRSELKQLIREIAIQEATIVKFSGRAPSNFNSKLKNPGVEYSSIEIDGVNPDDYPDYADVYIYYAEWKDGTPLTNEELDKLNELDEFIDYAHERAHD
jgi:hypothetical protein